MSAFVVFDGWFNGVFADSIAFSLWSFDPWWSSRGLK